MSIVTPIPQNTNIKAYKGIPWDRTLQDIRLFDTAAQRNSFLNPHLIGQWNNCSIASVGRSIRVQAYYNNCMECNYLSFVNTQEGTPDRTFYAYVTAVNYINVNTVEFVYEIDWIQSYLFDFVFEECFVEREHVNDDVQGNYVLEEGIDFGEYVIDQKTNKTFQPSVVINFIRDAYSAAITDGIYLPGHVSVIDLTKETNRDALNSILTEFNATPERITSFFMGVVDMQTATPEDPNTTFFYKNFTILEDDYFHIPGGGTFIPQNNKLLCYPYKFLTADNFSGSVQQYRWELFNTAGRADFTIEGSAIPKPCMMLFPFDYRQSKADASQTNNYEQECLFYENFPAIPYISDSYQAWVSQYGMSFAVEQAAQVGVSVAGTLGSLAVGNIPGAITGAATGVANYAESQANVKEKKIHALQSHGGVSTSGLSYARGDVGFRLTEYSIGIEDARRIDKFFTRYGYKVDKVKTPNIRGRQNVNYVKCSTGRVAGNIAVDAKIQMEQALQQGTSFWHVNNIGGEVTSNPIVSTS